MKRSFFLLILIITPYFVQSQSVSKLDEKYGFRDVIFEKPLSDYKGMVYAQNGNNGTKLYQRKTDNLSLGDYKFANLVYSFYNGKSYKVIIKIKGEHDSNGVLSILRKQYGFGEKHPDYKGSYVWFGEKASMFFLYDLESGNAEVSILSNTMDETVYDDKKKRAAAATSDL